MPSSTFATGHDLVGRYRILELLGVGQTAEVYRAEDLSLQRIVVVKVLLAHLAEHEEVRRAFRDRIIRAATLSHPHLARVFDGGQEHGAIFMICEYLGGGSLEDVLASGRTLSVDDGARLGRDVSNALAYVHENGFVHGSLSPSKLLFDDEGRVRVSDIALAGLGMGFRERFTLDDVRFLSPEQAIGDPATPKSDVYALALILFEAVTGTTAFDGVTPEAVLRARINAPLPIRPELGTLDMLLAQAAVSDPRLRLDAEQFASRLSAVVSDRAPLVVAPVGTEVPLLAQFRPTEPRNSIGFRPPSPDQVVGSTGPNPTIAPFPTAPRPRAGGVPGGRDPFANTPRRVVPRDIDHIDYGRPPRRRRIAFLVAALLLLVVAAGGGAAWKLGLFTQKHVVPSLIGVSYLKAPQALASDGFTLSVDGKVHSATVPVNDIVTQSPAAGANAQSGQAINVTVSSGPLMVAVPTNLVGEDCALATAQLARLHLSGRCPSSASVPSTVTPAGRVARVLYRSKAVPKSVPSRSALTLSLSTGPPSTTGTPTTTTTLATTTPTTTTTVASSILVAMPDVVGMDQAQVLAAMKAAKLYYFTSGPGSGAKPTWTTVVSQSPAAGTKVKQLSTVNLKVK